MAVKNSFYREKMTNPNNANVYLPGTIQIPSALQITAITQSNPMVLTFSINPVTEAETYIPGQLVRLNIPYGYGMQQANGLIGQILNISGSTMTLYINSTQFDPFSVPSTGTMPATLSPAGSRNLLFNNFTNQVPFQSLNNIGN